MSARSQVGRDRGIPPLRLRSVETPVAHPLFSIGYDAASFMLFGGPTAHGHSGQALPQSARKNGAPSLFGGDLGSNKWDVVAVWICELPLTVLSARAKWPGSAIDYSHGREDNSPVFRLLWKQPPLTRSRHRAWFLHDNSDAMGRIL